MYQGFDYCELYPAGGTTAVFVSPLEVLKTRLQTQVKGQGTKYLGGIHIYGTPHLFVSPPVMLLSFDVVSHRKDIHIYGTPHFFVSPPVMLLSFRSCVSQQAHLAGCKTSIQRLHAPGAAGSHFCTFMPCSITIFMQAIHWYIVCFYEYVGFLAVCSCRKPRLHRSSVL